MDKPIHEIYAGFTPKAQPEDAKKIFSAIVLIACILGALVICLIAGCREPVWASETEYSNEQIANAIYFAEGGAKTRHPYGILAHYKNTTPRQACLNTIAHARRDFKGGDFITFLGNRYCPIGAKNDPTGLNKNWVKNVKRILRRKNWYWDNFWYLRHSQNSFVD